MQKAGIYGGAQGDPWFPAATISDKHTQHSLVLCLALGCGQNGAEPIVLRDGNFRRTGSRKITAYAAKYHFGGMLALGVNACDSVSCARHVKHTSEVCCTTWEISTCDTA